MIKRLRHTEEKTNTEIFTGKARAYASARPSYPEEAVAYIFSLLPDNAVLADIGAGTGKLTVLLAKRGSPVFAVEPNADMREQLTATLAPYPNAQILSGTAEATGLPDGSADAVLCAQALHWFDPAAFRAECRRIGNPGALVIAVYNNTPGGSSVSHRGLATEAFFSSPTVRDFPNPITYTRESWLTYRTSHSHDPLPSDPAYAAHIAEAEDTFNRESVGGVLRVETVTYVYSEKIYL